MNTKTTFKRDFEMRYGVSPETKPEQRDTAQPTPGPWTTEQTSDHGASVRVMDEQDVTVALCYQQPFDTWTAEANAKLIANAPQTLAHAQRLAETLKLGLARTLENFRQDHPDVITMRATLAQWEASQ